MASHRKKKSRVIRPPITRLTDSCTGLAGATRSCRCAHIWKKTESSKTIRLSWNKSIIKIIKNKMQISYCVIS